MFIGTFGHEIYKVDFNVSSKTFGKTGEPLVQGHYAPLKTPTTEAWGLGYSPGKANYVATSSDDSTLRIWDIANHKQVGLVDLSIDENGKKMPVNPKTKECEGSMGRSVAMNYAGNELAVGMRDGSLRVYSVSFARDGKATCQLKYRQKLSKEWIEDLKYSPDDKYLAIGSHDNKIYMYYCQHGKVVKRKKDGKPLGRGSSTSFITHIDWNETGDVIRTTDGSYEILYYNMPKVEQDTSGGSNHKDTDFATQSCVLGWHVQGIWQPEQDGSDINHCDATLTPFSDGSQIIATANDDSKIRLIRYPAMVE